MSDLINRQDALKPFCIAPDGTRIPEVDCDNFPVEFSVEFIKKHLLSLPSAEAIQVNGDLINRQDAIDAIEKYDFNFPEYMGRFVTELREAMKEDLKDDIVALPSAEPKTMEWEKVIDKDSLTETLWHYECDQCGAGRLEKGQRYCRHYNVWCEYANGMGECGYKMNAVCHKHYDKMTCSDRTEK